MQATHNPTHSTTGVDPTPADVLRGAARYLQVHGWIRGAFFEPDANEPFPAACATGAIRMAATGSTRAAFSSFPEHPDRSTLIVRTQRVFAHYLDDTLQVRTFDPDEISAIDVIGDWNDDKDRTVEDVTAALDDAARDWDARHPAVTR